MEGDLALIGDHDGNLRSLGNAESRICDLAEWSNDKNTTGDDTNCKVKQDDSMTVREQGRKANQSKALSQRSRRETMRIVKVA